MKHLIFPTLILAALPLQAGVLTPDQALERALLAGPASRAASSSSSAPRFEFAGSRGPLYLFSSDRGSTLVTTSDSRLRPVLAIADSPADEIPEVMNWWLDLYQAEIEQTMPALDAAAAAVRIPADNYASWQPIEPFVTSKWDQGAPYNTLCPAGTSAGCVATAMAQVIYTNRYAKGAGSHSYYGPSGTLSFDFSKAEFDFSKMTDTYNASSSQQAKDAVAELIYACGVSVNTLYGPESGANGAAIAPALTTYFGYDKTYTMDYWRPLFQTPQWEQIIYNELKAGRCVLYGGSAPSGGGHAFVVDGYSDNGLFHINWGWSGSSNGYFALSALNPYTQGIGSSAGGYNGNQYIVLVVKPGAKSPQKVTVPDPMNKADISGCRVVDLSLGAGLYIGSDANISFSIANTGKGDYNDFVHVGIVNADGAEPCYVEYANTVVVPGDVVPVSVKLHVEGEKELTMSPGKYTLRINDHWGRSIGSYEVDVKSGTPVGSWDPGALTFYVNDVDNMPSEILSGQAWPHNPTFNSTKSQKVRLDLRFFEPGTDKEVATVKGPSTVTFPVSTNKAYSWSNKAPKISLPWGVYDVCYVNTGNEVCSDRRTICVGEATDGLNLIPAADGLSARLATGSYSGHVVVPAEVNTPAGLMPLSGICANAFYSASSLLSLDLPATVTSVGINALRHTAAMTGLVIRSEQPPFDHEALFTFGMHYKAAVYVPEQAYAAYTPLFNVHKVYSIIDGLTAPEDRPAIPVGDEAEVTVGVAPGSLHFNPECLVEVVPADLADFVSSSVGADGTLRLRFKGLADGPASVKVTPLQPGVEPIEFTMQVGDASSITEVGIDSDSAPAAIYDLMGRRVTSPRPGGIYIVNGRKLIFSTR